MTHAMPRIIKDQHDPKSLYQELMGMWQKTLKANFGQLQKSLSSADLPKGCSVPIAFL